MMSYKDRIDKIRERGYLTGLNDINPLPPERIPELYHDNKYMASDHFLEMQYAKEYYRGQNERMDIDGIKVRPIDRKKALVLSRVKQAEAAFAYGMAAREWSEVRNWMLDKNLCDMLSKAESTGEGQGYVDAWIAGFHLRDEEKRENEIKEPAILDYTRMCDLRNAYEEGDEPELGTPANKAYQSYSKCVKLLDMEGVDLYRKCLSCPGKFRYLGDRSDRYGDENFDGDCEEDCAEADRVISEVCEGYIEDLYDYYTVQRTSGGER